MVKNYFTFAHFVIFTLPFPSQWLTMTLTSISAVNGLRDSFKYFTRYKYGTVFVISSITRSQGFMFTWIGPNVNYYFVQLVLFQISRKTCDACGASLHISPIKDDDQDEDDDVVEYTPRRPFRKWCTEVKSCQRYQANGLEFPALSQSLPKRNWQRNSVRLQSILYLSHS